MLYWSPAKPEYVGYLDNSLKEKKISNIQERYLMSDFKVNFLCGSKMLLDIQYYDSCSQVPPLIKKNIDLCFSHSLHQLIAEPTRATERTVLEHL